MGSHHTDSCFFITGMTGYHNSTPVHPHPHILSRYQERIAVVAELAAEFTVNPDPLSHRDFPCQTDIAVTPFRVGSERFLRLPEQDLDTFPGNLFCDGVAGSFFHGLVIFPDSCAKLSAYRIKKER